MKNTVKFLGIIAMVAVIGFSMIACDDGNGGGGGGNAALANYVGTWQNNATSFELKLSSDGKFLSIGSDSFMGKLTLSGTKMSYDLMGIVSGSATVVLSNDNKTLTISAATEDFPEDNGVYTKQE